MDRHGRHTRASLIPLNAQDLTIAEMEHLHLSVTTIPHPPKRVPLLGDIRGMDRVRPNQKTLWQFSQLGPIYRRSIIGGIDLTFVGSGALMEEALDESLWERYIGAPIAALRTFAGDGLFTAPNDSQAWIKGHEALVKGFSKDSLRNYHETMLEVSAALGDELKTVPSQSNFAGLSNSVALEVIGRCGFSYSFGFGSNTSEERTEFVAALTRSLAFTQENSVPVLGQLTGRKRRKQAAADAKLVLDTVDRVVAERRESSERTNDLLDRMLHPESAATALDAENIRQQILTFLVAGHETTGNLLAFAAYFIATHPVVAQKMRDERSAIAGNRPLLFDEVAKLRYTRAVISETLRLWPSAPGFFRAARTDTTLGGHEFKAGEWVFILLLAVHRDQEVWGPDAAEFKPDRFLTDRTPVSYKPFGTGPRACIGRQFALHEATIVLSDLAANFTIEAAGGSRLDVEENLTLRPANLELHFAAH